MHGQLDCPTNFKGKKMKKIQYQIILLVIGMFLAAGCGGNSKKSDVSDESLLVTVPDNISPVAIISANAFYAVQGENITLDASKSNDPDGNIVSYQWLFMDGQALGEGKKLIYNTGKLKAGSSYRIRLLVTDNSGATAIASAVLAVAKKADVLPPDPKPEHTCQNINPVTGHCED